TEFTQCLGDLAHAALVQGRGLPRPLWHVCQAFCASANTVNRCIAGSQELYPLMERCDMRRTAAMGLWCFGALLAIGGCSNDFAPTEMPGGPSLSANKAEGGTFQLGDFALYLPDGVA